MTKLVLIGAGGHSKVIQDIVAENRDIELYAIVDDAFTKTVKKEGIIQGNTSLLDTLQKEEFQYCLAIGNNRIRKKLFEKFCIPIEQYATLIHSSAVISKSAVVGNGTVIMPNVVVNGDSVIGNHSILNTGSVVEHDNVLGNYVHLSPNATLAGTVSIYEGTHIGAGAVVIPGMHIGRWSVIGAGGVVVADVEDNVTVVGVPARKLK
ncbi:acetyltransferase [Oceanobacillus zhaokaii]|uniref:Acetyltransferase n=1 Tax=Oceanobacillus zhaokaii TaxID=2052660 RepID=A0A345PKD1_9BACI|nr:acetyltransferase [Oceanobacillus zhaokaii]AXI10461.1 acetyltransferase [Oceanobacillus zhaokaii]